MKSRIALTAVLSLGLYGALGPAALAAGNRPADGLYAPKASGKLPYSNGAVNLQVASGGRKIVFPSGVACYTGAYPPAGVPTNDEVSIHIPKTLTIGGDGSFSFSGPVTLTAEEAQSESPIKTTYTIKGRFKWGPHESWTAVGTDHSPICQASTESSFKLPLAEKGS